MNVGAPARKKQKTVKKQIPRQAPKGAAPKQASKRAVPKQGSKSVVSKQVPKTKSKPKPPVTTKKTTPPRQGVAKKAPPKQGKAPKAKPKTQPKKVNASQTVKATPKVPTKPKAMKPTIDLDSEVKVILQRQKAADDGAFGWDTHPELVAPINLNGKWRSTGQSSAGAFNFVQEDDALSGSIESGKSSCTISGKIDPKKRTLAFVQKFEKGKSVVDVTGSVELTVMKTRYTYGDPKKPKTGEATLVQEPTGSMTGVWAPLESSINFHIFHYPSGLVLGYLDKPEFCQVFGTLRDNKLRIQQEWVGKGSIVQCVGEIIGDELLVMKYGYYNGDNLVTGKTTFSRKNGRVPVAPKGWSVSLVKESNVEKEMEFTPQSEVIKKTAAATPTAKNPIDSGLNEVVQNAEFCVKSGDITWHRERFTPQILTRSIPYGVKLTKNDKGSSYYPLYYPDMKILVLGEADFSFTLGLALQLNGQGPLSNLVGTSFLEKADVPRNLFPPNFQHDPRKRTFINENSDVNHNLLKITGLGAHVRFGVDARQIDETLRQGENAFCSPHALPMKLDRIIFPFPRASLKRTNWNEENQLLRGLFMSSKRELTSNGELHLILHTSKLGINQFDMWGVRQLAEACGFVWRSSLPFNFRLLAPYYPKDVESNRWTPFEASIQIFTPKNNGFRVEKRLWREPPAKEQKKVKRLKVCPKDKKYADSKFTLGHKRS